MKKILTVVVFVSLLLAFLGVLDKCGSADLGYAVGQNGVRMVEFNWGKFNYARHINDGTYDIFSVRLAYSKAFGATNVSAFAGIGYGHSGGTPQDLAGSTIGHWGIQATYKALGLRISHWSNPFANSEYGHNMLTLFWRW